MTPLTPAEAHFRQGLRFYRNEYYAKAHGEFLQAAQLDNTNPHYLSYLGVTTARVERKFKDAEALCHQALRMMRTDPLAYLNLAEVYIWSGHREEAVDTLSIGLQYTKRDARLQRLLNKLGVRRPPVIRFLDRRNFLNRQLGRIRHRVLKGVAKG